MAGDLDVVSFVLSVSSGLVLVSGWTPDPKLWVVLQAISSSLLANSLLLLKIWKARFFDAFRYSFFQL